MTLLSKPAALLAAIASAFYGRVLAVRLGDETNGDIPAALLQTDDGIVEGQTEKKAKIMVLGANMGGFELDPENIMALLTEAVKSHSLGELDKEWDLPRKKPGEEDSDENWEALRKKLAEIGPDLIVVGCQECAWSSNSYTPLQKVGCTDKMGVMECGTAEDPSLQTLTVSDDWKITRQRTKDPEPGMYAIVGEYKKTTSTKPPLVNMMYQGVLAKAGGAFDVKTKHVDLSTTIGWFGNKGGIVSKVKVGKVTYSFANVHLDASDPKYRQKNAADIVKALGAEKLGPDDVSVIYGDMNYRIYAKDKGGSDIEDNGPEAKKVVPDKDFYYNKLQDKAARGEKPELLYSLFKDLDEFETTWSESPFNKSGYKQVPYTENVLPTYKIAGFQRDAKDNEADKDACVDMRNMFLKREKWDGPTFDWESCYVGIGKGTKLTKKCAGPGGKKMRCVDFGWLDRALVKGPLEVKVHTTIGWQVQTTTGLGDHTPLLVIGEVPYPKKEEQTKGEGEKEAKGKSKGKQ